MLHELISTKPYALGMSPGFFQFYAYVGVLHALEDHGCLQVTHVCGSSAGALVGGFLAAGMKPEDMIHPVFSIKREDIWDMGGIGGLLKGQLLQKLLESNLQNCPRVEDCKIPIGITAWELFGFRTKLIYKGDLATAIRASCCFPVLFQPVSVDGSICIDGGVFDHGGLMALPGLPESKFVVNILGCGHSVQSSVLPDEYADANLLTIILKNIPGVSPLNMDHAGYEAYKVARSATYKALRNCHMQQISNNHWCCYIDGKDIDVTGEDYLSSYPPMSNVEDNKQDERFQIPIEPAIPQSSNGASLIFSHMAPVFDEPPSQFAEFSSKISIPPPDQHNFPVVITPPSTPIQLKSDRLPETVTKSGKRKYREMESETFFINEKGKQNIDNETLDDMCYRLGVKAVPPGKAILEEIETLSTEESLELANVLLVTSKTIAFMIMPDDMDPIENKRKSRRRSSINRALFQNDVWKFATVLREASVRERRFGYTHLVRIHSHDHGSPAVDKLLVLNVFGYYNTDTSAPLRQNRMALQQDTWVVVDVQSSG